MVERHWYVACSLAAAGALAMSSVAAASAATPSGDTPAPVAVVTDVPVLGTFTFPRYSKFDGETIIGAVHAVRRVPGATAVYYSVGTEPSSGARLLSSLVSQPAVTPYGRMDMTGVTIIDTAAKIAYRPLFVKGEGGLVSSPVADTFPAGTLVTAYALLPELPADVTTVDLALEWGVIMAGLPVADGPLLPAVAETWVPVGEGWPALPDAQRIAAADPSASTFDLTSRVGDIDESTETDTSPDEVAVNLSADFFFAPGEWELTAKGRTRVLEVADDLVAANVDRATVVGHTDSVPDKVLGNKQLSKRRAQAVADVLRERAPQLDLKVEGRGPSEPVASNDTDAGKKKNRRVTMTYEVSK